MLLAVKVQPTKLSNILEEKYHDLASLKSMNQTNSQLDIAERSLGFENNSNSLHKFTTRKKPFNTVYHQRSTRYRNPNIPIETKTQTKQTWDYIQAGT
jgi:hypothetical protein